MKLQKSSVNLSKIKDIPILKRKQHFKTSVIGGDELENMQTQITVLIPYLSGQVVHHSGLHGINLCIENNKGVHIEPVLQFMPLTLTKRSQGDSRQMLLCVTNPITAALVLSPLQICKDVQLAKQGATVLPCSSAYTSCLLLLPVRGAASHFVS